MNYVLKWDSYSNLESLNIMVSENFKNPILKVCVECPVDHKYATFVSVWILLY